MKSGWGGLPPDPPLAFTCILPWALGPTLKAWVNNRNLKSLTQNPTLKAWVENPNPKPLTLNPKL